MKLHFILNEIPWISRNEIMFSKWTHPPARMTRARVQAQRPHRTQPPALRAGYLRRPPPSPEEKAAGTPRGPPAPRSPRRWSSEAPRAPASACAPACRGSCSGSSSPRAPESPRSSRHKSHIHYAVNLHTIRHLKCNGTPDVGYIYQNYIF